MEDGKVVAAHNFFVSKSHKQTDLSLKNRTRGGAARPF